MVHEAVARGEGPPRGAVGAGLVGRHADVRLRELGDELRVLVVAESRPHLDGGAREGGVGCGEPRPVDGLVHRVGLPLGEGSRSGGLRGMAALRGADGDREHLRGSQAAHDRTLRIGVEGRRQPAEPRRRAQRVQGRQRGTGVRRRRVLRVAAEPRGRETGELRIGDGVRGCRAQPDVLQLLRVLLGDLGLGARDPAAHDVAQGGEEEVAVDRDLTDVAEARDGRIAAPDEQVVGDGRGPLHPHPGGAVAARPAGRVGVVVSEAEGVAADGRRRLGDAVADGQEAQSDAVDQDVVLEHRCRAGELHRARAAVGEDAAAHDDAIAGEAEHRAVPRSRAHQRAPFVVVIAPGAVEEQSIENEAVVLADALQHARLARHAKAGAGGEHGRGAPRRAGGEVGAVAAEHGEVGAVDGPRGPLAATGVGSRGDMDAVARRCGPQCRPRVVEGPLPGSVAGGGACCHEEVGHLATSSLPRRPARSWRTSCPSPP